LQRQVLALKRLGTRAVIAKTHVAQAENVQKAVTLLCEAGGRGDLAAAKALVPYLDQGLGKPTERVEHRTPQTMAELEELSTEELERIVREGRARRSGLPAASELEEWPVTDDEHR
jgi:hypothetical protein